MPLERKNRIFVERKKGQKEKTNRNVNKVAFLAAEMNIRRVNVVRRVERLIDCVQYKQSTGVC